MSVVWFTLISKNKPRMESDVWLRLLLCIFCVSLQINFISFCWCWAQSLNYSDECVRRERTRREPLKSGRRRGLFRRNKEEFIRTRQYVIKVRSWRQAQRACVCRSQGVWLLPVVVLSTWALSWILWALSGEDRALKINNSLNVYLFISAPKLPVFISL